MLKDSYARIIDYLRISVTDRCNLRCRYCMPACGIIHQPHQELLSFEEIIEIVNLVVQLGIDKIRLTGGEPLVRKELVNLISSLSKIDSLKDISLTTNGILLKEYALGLKKAGLKRVNISLDSLRSDRYRWITRGGNLEDVLKGISEALKVGFSPLKINVLLLEINKDEIPDFLRLTIENPLHVRFLEFMPVNPAPLKRCGVNPLYKMGNFISAHLVMEIARHFYTVEEARIYPASIDRCGVYGNGPARVYKFKNSWGTFGIISPISDKFCFRCNRLRLTCDGFLKACLHADLKVNLRDALRKRDKEGLIGLIKSAVYMKPREHSLDKSVAKSLEYSMCQIGG